MSGREVLPNLGYLYDDDQGGAQDYARARDCYPKSAGLDKTEKTIEV